VSAWLGSGKIPAYDRLLIATRIRTPFHSSFRCFGPIICRVSSFRTSDVDAIPAGRRNAGGDAVVVGGGPPPWLGWKRRPASPARMKVTVIHLRPTLMERPAR